MRIHMTLLSTKSFEFMVDIVIFCYIAELYSFTIVYIYIFGIIYLVFFKYIPNI